MKNRIPSYEFRRLLEDTPLSDREIADAVEVSHTTVRRWRIGKANPSVGNVRDVADLHDATLNEIRGRLTKIRQHVGYWEEIQGLKNGGGRD